MVGNNKFLDTNVVMTCIYYTWAIRCDAHVSHHILILCASSDCVQKMPKLLGVGFVFSSIIFWILNFFFRADDRASWTIWLLYCLCWGLHMYSTNWAGGAASSQVNFLHRFNCALFIHPSICEDLSFAELQRAGSNSSWHWLSGGV